MNVPKLKRLGATWLLTGLFVGGCVTTGVTEQVEEANAIVDADPFAVHVDSPPAQHEWNVVYENDWSAETVGEEPADLFVLDGAFTVTEVDGDKALALPGVPVGDFGFLFGPRVKGKPTELRCRMFSTRKGRRMPAFAAGLGGVSGYRLRVNAAARNLQLLRGEETLVTVPNVWQDGAWMNLRFRAEPKGDAGAVVFAKVWSVDSEEPADWTVVHKDPKPYAGGKCTLWGLPYAGTEILFDDLKVLAFGVSE